MYFLIFAHLFSYYENLLPLIFAQTIETAVKDKFLPEIFRQMMCVTLAFVCVQLDTGLEIFQLISGQKVCHYLGGDNGGGGSRQTVINGDRGGGGSKIGIFTVTYFLNGPFIVYPSYFVI